MFRFFIFLVLGVMSFIIQGLIVSVFVYFCSNLFYICLFIVCLCQLFGKVEIIRNGVNEFFVQRVFFGLIIVKRYVKVGKRCFGKRYCIWGFKELLVRLGRFSFILFLDQVFERFCYLLLRFSDFVVIQLGFNGGFFICLFLVFCRIIVE